MVFRWYDVGVSPRDRVLARYLTAGHSLRHGPFRLQLEEGLDQEAVTPVLQALDKASEAIRRRFGSEVLYGDVAVVRKVKLGETFYASYNETQDRIELSIEAEGDGKSVHALVHEFGHRYESKRLPRELRDEFKRLISGGPVFRTFTYAERKRIAGMYRQALLDETYIEDDLYDSWLNAEDRPNKDRANSLASKFFDGEVSVLDDLVQDFAALRGPGEVTIQVAYREPLRVSGYAAGDWHENFAEAFAYVALGRALPQDIATFMRKL